jgi:DNA segregation ATPase FtsK/SpoIIIE, S-DNA-T family
MPLINVIPGDKIPTAPMNVRMPTWRPPGWLLLAFWTVRGLWRLAVLTIRYWWLTAPGTTALYVWAAYGWPVLVGLVIAVVGGCVAWWRLHPASWLRFGWHPLVGRWRRLWVYRRCWTSAMATCGLAMVFDGDRYIPQLLRVRADRWGDQVTVRLLPGQMPDDWATVAPRLAYTFRVQTGRAYATARPDRVVLRFQRRDPLATVLRPLPVPATPDFTALPLGVREPVPATPGRLTSAHRWGHQCG